MLTYNKISKYLIWGGGCCNARAQAQGLRKAIQRCSSTTKLTSQFLYLVCKIIFLSRYFYCYLLTSRWEHFIAYIIQLSCLDIASSHATALQIHHFQLKLAE